MPTILHPVVAAHGYTAYYLNMLAGSAQSLAASDDPHYAWVKAKQAIANRADLSGEDAISTLSGRLLSITGSPENQAPPAPAEAPAAPGTVRLRPSRRPRGHGPRLSRRLPRV